MNSSAVADFPPRVSMEDFSTLSLVEMGVEVCDKRDWQELVMSVDWREVEGEEVEEVEGRAVILDVER